jgi:AAA-like domain/TIR domain
MSAIPRNQVFVSYSHKDKRWLGILETHLKPLVRQGRISIWDDTKILPGTNWREEIWNAIAGAKVAVLLVSPDFLASDFISENELPPLLEAAAKEGLTILWIAVRESLYRRTAIEHYQAASNPDRPLAGLRVADRERELVRICEKIEAAVGGPSQFPLSGSTSSEHGLAGYDSIHGHAAQRVVFLYKRDKQPDEQLLKFLEVEFKKSGYVVFVDRHLKVGVEWAEEISSQIRDSDVVIPLLSSTSVTSEMMISEIQAAHEAGQQRWGKPRLLPVRLQYEDPLAGPLGTILNPLQYASWYSTSDNERVLNELKDALRSPPNVRHEPSTKVEPVGGAIPLDSEFYIVRSTDEEFMSALSRRDSIVLIKGARQMGKTSLLARGLQQARRTGSRVVLTDFQMLSAIQMESADTFFMALAETIADQLELDVSVAEIWRKRSGPGINFQRYLQSFVFPRISSPMVWGLDEVDRLFTCDFGSDVFGLFRSWHNARSLDPTGPWERLTLAIAYATEAHLFITNMNQSPFNVGTQLTLEDFTIDQVNELNRRYGSPLHTTAELLRYFGLVGGHPYLVRLGLLQLVTYNRSLTTFESQADRDEGPLGSHLRRVLVSLAQEPAMLEIVRGILRGVPIPSDDSFYRLRSAGILLGESRDGARLRCGVYGRYLERHLL